MKVCNKSTLTLVCIMLLSGLYAQKREKFYDYKWQECNREDARFFTSITKTDSAYCRKDYYLRERKLHTMGYFKDSLLQIKNGKFHYFHANGYPKSFGKYVDGKKEGVWLSYHDNKIISDSCFYVHDRQVGRSLSWHPNGQLSDSAYTYPDGSGIAVSWFDTGVLSSTGIYSKGHKQQGLWKYYHPNGKISSLETYVDNNLTKREYFDENGVPMSSELNTDRKVTFPGGEKAWLKYIDKHVYFPPEYKIMNSDAATIVITFTINESGQVENVYASTGFYKAFDEIPIDAIKKSPRWIPAVEHNRTVKARFSQAINYHQIEW